MHGVTVLRVLSLRFRGGVTVLRVLSSAARSAAGKFWDVCVPMPGKEYIFARLDCAEGLGLGLRVLRFGKIVTPCIHPPLREEPALLTLSTQQV